MHSNGVALPSLVLIDVVGRLCLHVHQVVDLEKVPIISMFSQIRSSENQVRVLPAARSPSCFSSAVVTQRADAHWLDSITWANPMVQTSVLMSGCGSLAGRVPIQLRRGGMILC